MATKIYGCSDDLCEIKGDVTGEISCYGTDDQEQGLLVMCSDGTILEVRYGKAGMGIWAIMPISQGSLFERMDYCANEEADPYSDVAHFKDGLKWAYAATEWQKVK